MNKLLLIQSDLTGGVLNIQSSVSKVQDGVDKFSNTGLMSNGSIYRAIQKGTINKTIDVPKSVSNQAGTLSISLSTLKNIDKSSAEISDFSISDSYGYVRGKFTGVTIQSNQIIINYTVSNSWNTTITGRISGSWKLKELW